MSTFELADNIILELPPKYIVKQEVDEDGELSTTICSGEYIDDYGEECYEFQGNLTYRAFNPDDYDEAINSNNLLEVEAKRLDLNDILKVPGEPETLFGYKELSISILGSSFDIFLLAALVKAKDNSMLLLVSNLSSEDDSITVDDYYKSFFEIIESVRMFGKKVSLDGISPKELKQHFETRSEDNLFTYDFERDYLSKFTEDDEFDAGFLSDSPDESLYPHYNSMMNAGLLGFPGMEVIVNQSGTEYEFYKFKDMLNSYSTDPEDEKMKPLLRKIYDQNPEGYTLGETARKMTRLFRVNKDAFVEGHDREAELLGNLMRRAYMMSALRSFAWTLAGYCEQENVTPETIDKSIPEQIADFVAMSAWLNYDDKSYCKGLCSGSDLHVYFIPDSVSEDDRKQFLPTQDDYDRVKNMQENFPSYFEILPEVHSLDSLRKDLEYIYPAVRILYEDLAAHRDHSEPLEGNAADVVYAWIALAMAAEGPFFTEDGPMNYRFGWPGEGEEIATPEQNDDAWGSGITVGGKAINDNDTGTSVDNNQDDAWGSGITVGGKAINDNDARTSVDDNQDDVWGSGITVGGKKI